MTMPLGCKVTRDENLVTETAIRNRIEALRRECGAALTPAACARIQRLKARLPKTDGQPVQPAIVHYPSKAEIDEYSSSAAVLV